MFRLSHKDYACLISILDSIDKIHSYSKDYNSADEFYENQLAFDATLMNFIVIGEMAEKISEEFKKETQENIDWFKINGFRNIIAHNYFGIDGEEVWQIIHYHLKPLKQNINLYI